MKNLISTYKKIQMNHILKKLISFFLVFSFFLISWNNSFAQTNYYSKFTGDLNILTTWGTNTDGSGTSPANFTSNNCIYNIRNNATPTFAASWTVSGTSSKIIVGDGTNACTFTVGSNYVLTSTCDVSNNAILKVSSSDATPISGTLTIKTGGTYEYAKNGGTISTATWQSGSTCLVTGITANAPGGLNQSFSNFTWNCASQSAAINFANALTTVNGNLSILNTNSNNIILFSDGTTLSIGGNFVMGNGTDNAAVRISSTNGPATNTINLSGDFTMYSNSSFNTKKNTNILNFNFTKTGTQVFTKTGGTIPANIINFTVNSGSILDMGTSVIDGSTGTFTLSSGAGIITQHPQGISTTAGTGCIQVTGTKTFNTNADYTYNGTENQVTGNALPATVHNLTINNTGTSPNNVVTLSSNVTVSNQLTLTSGTFAVDTHILTLNGPAINGTPANLSTTSSSSLTFGGSATGINIPSSVAQLSNLSINNTSGVTLNSNITLSGDSALTLATGILYAEGYSIRVTNTTTTAISQGTTTNYISGGSLSRVLNTGGTINFPVGSSTCGGLHQFTLNNPNIVNGSELKVTYACTGVGTPDMTTITSLPFTFNWKLELVAGTFTSTDIKIESTDIDMSNKIGYCATQGGVYSLLPNCIVGTGYTTATGVTSLPKYFTPSLSLVKTYYSYQTGNWNNPTTWTLDPSGTTQVGSAVPGNNSIIYILSGRTVSLTSDTNTTNLDINIEEGGILNTATYHFTAGFNSLSGKGTLRIASDVFPTPINVNNFVLPDGGTTEYTTGITLPSQATYCNLTINAPSSTVLQTINLNLNGDLHVKSGNFQINDATARRLTLNIAGNVTVDANGSITVGTGVTNSTTDPNGITGGTAPFLNYYDQQSHRIVVNGDFTNNGTVKFTNLTYPVYNAFPPTTVGTTTGFATVYFQGATDNTLICNGTTNFYNLVLDKGIDKTFKLTIYTSGSYNNFRLFGANTATCDATSANPDINKALWIRTGSLVLEGTTVIPSLTEGTTAASSNPNSDYIIPANGALILNGIDVIVQITADDYKEINAAYGTFAPNNATIGLSTSGIGSSLTLYGKLQMNLGYLTTKESSGIITNNVYAGKFILNNGTVDTKQFLSLTGAASYEQNGGTFIVRGRFQRTPTSYTNATDLKNAPLNTIRANDASLNASVGSFNINDANNVFIMSGGNIKIYDVCGTTSPTYAFQVNSSTSNINVTGGTIEFIPTLGTGGSADATYHYISSTASLGNVTINNQAGCSSIIYMINNPLTILQNLTLTSGTLNANDLNISIGGNFTIENGTSYITGANTTILNGSGAQTFTINLSSALTLNKFSIIKPLASALNLAGSQKTINVTDNFRLELGTLNDNGDTINLAKDCYNSGIHTGIGKIVLNGTLTQTIDGNGIFQNLELNNTNAGDAPISLLANTTVNGTLNLVSNKIFNIGNYNLKIGTSGNITATAFSNSCYLHSSGNAGDGGISKAFSANTTFTFPVGCFSTKRTATYAYTPATISLSSGFTGGDGYITIIPVGYEHPVTTTKNQSLTFFWRLKSSGFSSITPGTVSHNFVYNETDINGTEANYIPSLYDRAAYTWNSGLAGNINTTTNTITDWNTPTNSSNFLDADYTAGDACFGTPTKFYSRLSGNWSTATTWSNISHTGTAASTTPGANDIVIIGNGNTVTLTADASCASLQIEAGSVLDIYTYTGGNFGMVQNHSSGLNGLFRLTTSVTSKNVPKLFSFPSGDFSDFNHNRGTTEFYDIDGAQGAVYILPSNVTTYGNLMVTAKGGDNLVFPNNALTTIYGDLTCSGDNSDAWIAVSWNTNVQPYYSGIYNPTIEKTIHVTGNLYVNNGTLIYMDDYAPQHLIIDGNMTVASIANVLANPPTSGYYNINGQPQANTLSIGGNLNNNTNAGNSISLRNVSNVNGLTYYCDVTFFGSTSATLTNTSGTPTTILNKVTVNKGSSQATTLTCNIGGTLTTLTDNWLTLQNGTFIYDRAGKNFNISTVTPFNIPATAGLNITNANNVFIANSASDVNDVYLNGKLTILNGTVYVGPSASPNNNNDIEYSANGASEIDIQGGSLIVNGQIRQNPSSTAGILTYKQSAGTVTINGNKANTTNAKLEVLNSGEFTMTGGILNILRGGGGSTYGDLFIRPSSGIVSGGTIVFSNVVPNTAQTYLIDATIPLNNLTITGAAGAGINATVKLMVNPLTLNGNLTLTNARSIFDANSVYDINLTLKGNFTNNGTYNYYKNLTTFNGDVQTLSGTSSTNFYDLTVNPLTSLTLSQAITVNNNLNLASGTFICGTNYVYVKNNLINNATYTNSNTTSGLVLNGTVQQQISGTGTFGQLELNNTNGSTLLNNITLNNNLILTSGIFDINQYLLTLGVNSNIIANGTPFSVTKMITSDGVWSNVGILKVFPVITVSTPFTYPLGTSGKYTPANLTISSNATVGSIRINNINKHHPAVLDPNNVLQYYWEVESQGISGFTGTLLLNYKSNDVLGGPESNYIAAQLLTPGTNWSKAAPGSLTDRVDETNHIITFNFNSSNNITGECTAGNSDAIPDIVPQYTSNQNGNWSNKDIWTPSGGSTYPCPDGGPNGFIVTIDHIVTLDNNYCTAYKTYLNNELKAVAPYFGHNLGTVYGNGTLFLESSVFPAGRYNYFFDCSGSSTLEYGGTGTYNVTADLYNSVPNITFSGTGTRVLPAKDLTICKQLKIDGPTLDNSLNNKHLYIMGTMLLNSGAFKSGTGADATVTFEGSSVQTVKNFNGTNAFNNLEIDNTYGLTLESQIDVAGNLLLTNGLITTNVSNILYISNYNVNCVTPNGGSSNSYINGPLKKKINQGDPVFIYPIGKQNYGLGDIFALRATQTGTQDWTVEMFTPDTLTTYQAPLTAVNAKEFWTVSGVANASQAYVEIGWSPTSDINPLMTTNGISDMQVAEHNGTDWVLIPSTASGTISSGTTETNAKAVLATGTRNYTLSCINQVKPRIRLNPSGPICGTAGIPVTLTTNQVITQPYTVSYTENGTPHTININSDPFSCTIPTIATGATYILTGFTYTSGGTQNGVVDPTPVVSYPVPTTADAGLDQSLCGASSTNLQGNSPTIGIGLWTITTGTGGTVTNPTAYNSSFSGTNGTGYTLNWTITSGTGSGACISSNSVNIDFPLNPVQPQPFTVASSIVCQEQSAVTYTVPLDPTATSYTWSYTGTNSTINTTNTNSITMDFGPNATSGTLSVYILNGCGNSPTRDFSITVVPRGTWTGIVSSDWFDPNNWSCPGLPLSTSNVEIPNSAPNMPIISAPGAICNNLTIDNGATLTLTGTNNLTVSGNWTNNSVSATGFIASNTSTVTFNGTTTISGQCGNTFGNVVIIGTLTAPACDLNVTGNLTNSGTFNNNAGTVNFSGTTTQTITSATEIIFNNLTISGTDVAISSNSKVTVSGSTNISGTLTLKSTSETETASFIQSNNYNQSGTVNVERYLTGNHWHFMFPTLSAIPTITYSKEGAYTNQNFYTYDETTSDYWDAVNIYGTTGWTSIPAGTIQTNEGFIYDRYQMPTRTVTQTGGSLYTSDKTFTVLYTKHSSIIGSGCTNDWNYYDGWNLVGNPYASAIDWEAVNLNYVPNVSGIEAGIYYYDDSTGNYKYYIQGGGTNPYDQVSGISVNGGSRYAPSGQGFMVKAANNNVTSTSFTIPNSARIHDAGTVFYKKNIATDNNILRMQISLNDFVDETVIRTLSDITGVTDNHDGYYDAYKMFTWDYTKPQIYTINTDLTDVYAINSLTEIKTSKTVPVGLYIGQAGRYTINFTKNTFENTLVYFEDKSTNPSTLILVNRTPSYSFNANTGTYNSRFAIHFNINHAPVSNTTFANQSVYQGHLYKFTANINFSDEDLYDSVRINVEYPHWLTYNAATKTFTGTPNNSDVGNYTIKFTGTDLVNISTEVSYNLEVINTNDDPIATSSIDNKTIYQNQEFLYTFDSNLFIDIDKNDSLTYSAQQVSGSNLPKWLNFNSTTHTFRGTPNNEDIGNYAIELLATDKSGASTNLQFNIEVINVNDKPYLINQLQDTEAYANERFEYFLPKNTFTDIDKGDSLSYFVTLSDDSPLPYWLVFSNTNMKLIGEPTDEASGDYKLKVIAKDKAGAIAIDTFNLKIISLNSIYNYSDSFIIYPNPTQGVFIIKSDLHDYNYEIIDQTGKIIQKAQTNYQYKNIDISNYPSGIYTLKIILSDKFIITKKITKL